MTVLVSRVALLELVLFAALGCGGGQPPAGDAPVREGKQVVFSVANKDRGAPVTVIRVVVNERTLIYGALQNAGQGEYLYFSADVDAAKLDIRVTCETPDGAVLQSEKTILVEDRLWIVITRLRNMEGVPEVVIEPSYEKPGPWSEE